MNKKSQFRYPTERYLNIIKQGYKDCRLDKKFLIAALQQNKWREQKYSPKVF